MSLGHHEMFALLRTKDASRRIAVVGASNDRGKYGNIIVRNLAGHGYTVWPVNPKEREVAGLPCFADVAHLPAVPDIVDVVTPPEVTLGVLRDCADAGTPNVWLQPGSFDAACLAFAREAPFSTEADACVMVVAGWS